MALRTLRARRSAFVGSFVALVCTCALITACGVLFQSALTSHPPTERYRDVPLVVAGRQSLAFTYSSGDGKNTEHVALPERVRPAANIAARMRAVSGVGQVVADVSLPVGLAAAGTEIPTPDVVRLHGWGSAQLTPYRLTQGRAPAGPAEVVVDAHLARSMHLRPGSRVTVAATDPAPGDYTVVGVAAPHRADPGPVVFVSDAEANRLTAGLVDVFGIYPAPGADSTAVAKSVRPVLRGLPLTVRTGDGRGSAEFLDVDTAVENVVALSATFGGISMAVALFVLAGTLALSVQQRRRELALLRAVGATGRQIRRLVGGETLVLGLLACLPGLAGGVALAWAGRAVLVDHGVAPRAMHLDVGWIPLLVGAGATALTAQLAVLVTGLRAGRLRPAQALHEAAAPPARLGLGRFLLGLLCAAGGISVVAATRFLTGGVLTAIAAGAVLLLLFAAALLGPLVARLALALLGPFIRACPAPAASSPWPTAGPTPDGSPRCSPPSCCAPPSAEHCCSSRPAAPTPARCRAATASGPTGRSPPGRDYPQASSTPSAPPPESPRRPASPPPPSSPADRTATPPRPSPPATSPACSTSTSPPAHWSICAARPSP
ncbi:ABC transporter permease [Frankia tisae]|uniref:ABC transporter permease n=1 Tax=Frankia tisae TaxID=2950104 RepID=UPI0021C037C2|nr:FtsX-like permease family protein [Frankia tisae]